MEGMMNAEQIARRRAAVRVHSIAAHMGLSVETGIEAAGTGASRVSQGQPPVTVLVTGAAGQIAYSLVFLVAQVRFPRLSV